MVISLEWIDVTVCKRNQHSVGGQLYFKNKQTHKKRLYLCPEVGVGEGTKAEPHTICSLSRGATRGRGARGGANKEVLERMEIRVS